jgi:hypothetical protein
MDMAAYNQPEEHDVLIHAPTSTHASNLLHTSSTKLIAFNSPISHQQPIEEAMRYLKKARITTRLMETIPIVAQLSSKVPVLMMCCAVNALHMRRCISVWSMGSSKQGNGRNRCPLCMCQQYLETTASIGAMETPDTFWQDTHE